MAKQQFFGIKYPFETESEDNYYVDLNDTFEDKIRSELLHIIFTQKGTRYRMPNFGTNLIRFLFEPNDVESWDAIKEEIRTQVSKYIPSVNFKDIKIIKNENDGNEIYANIEYSVMKGGTEKENNFDIRIV